MTEIDRRFANARRWLAWSGTMDELRAIARVAEDAYHERRTELLNQVYRDTEVEEPAHSEDSTLREIEEYSYQSRLATRDQQRANAEAELAFRVSFSDSPEETVGAAEGVLPQIDRRTVENIRLFARDYRSGDKLNIEFNRKQSFINTVVEFTLESSNVSWARATFSRVADEIDKGQPRWAWIYSPWGAGTFFGLTALAFFAAAVIAVWPESQYTADAWVGLVWVVLVSSLIASAVLTARPVKTRLFPRFEIRDDSGRPTGTRVLLWFLALLATIVAGYWVNIVS